jgi:hypothetical protein
MTIFGEVARKVIHERVRAACTASADADISTSTTFFAQIGFARDLTLSKAKRELMIEKLLPDIDKPTNSVDDDTVCKHFQTLIRNCKNETLNKANSNPIKFGKGTTEPALDKLIMILQTIFDKLTDLNLLNIPNDQDPLNNFRYYVALYYAKKIAADSEAGSWDINLAKKIDLTRAQETLIVRALTTCTKNINKIDGDKKLLDQLLEKEPSSQEDLEHKEMRRSQIALSVSWLQQNNNDVCQRFTPSTPGLAYFDPNDGILTRCLDEAVAAIGELDCAPKPVFPEQNQTIPLRVGSPKGVEASADTPLELGRNLQSTPLPSVDIANPANSANPEEMAPHSFVLDDQTLVHDQTLVPATRLESPERKEPPVVHESIKPSSISEATSVATATVDDIVLSPQPSKPSSESIVVKPAGSAPNLFKSQKKAHQRNQAVAEQGTPAQKPF